MFAAIRIWVSRIQLHIIPSFLFSTVLMQAVRREFTHEIVAALIALGVGH
jgi:hypothetical protein